MINIDYLQEYIVGMERQLSETKRQLYMLEGAIGFANQLIEDAKKGEVIPPPESPSNVDP